MDGWGRRVPVRGEHGTDDLDTGSAGTTPGRAGRWMPRAGGRVRAATAAVAAVVFLACGPSPARGFTDVAPSEPFSAPVDELAQRGYLSGFPDGTYRPDAPITRQQFAKSLALTLGLPVTEGDICPFADVAIGGPDTLYPDNHIAALAERGIVKGVSERRFAPTATLSHGQAAAFIARAASWADPDLPFRWEPPPPSGGAADPYSPVSRGEAAGLLAALLHEVLERPVPPPAADAVAGVVRAALGPGRGREVPGATVRVQATDLTTVTDRRGRFELGGLDPAERVVVTAWAPGFFIASSGEVVAGAADVDIGLRPLPSGDDPRYEWLSAFGTDPRSANCERCHSADDAAGDPLPFDDWAADAHAGSARNLRFLTMYAGTDVHGNESPPTRYVWDRDYGRRPLPPDPSLPYFGPGYRLDFTETTGNCAACHVPTAAVDDPYGVDPTTIAGVAAEGIGCDFCHKVWDVILDPATGLPPENAPGVLSYVFRRPAPGSQFFAGPYDDVAPGDDTFSGLQRESLYCAPCHTARFWGTQVYDSYGEWAASAYSDPNTGRTCQDCHMPHRGGAFVARADVGGNSRDPASVRSHLMPGAADPELLQAAVSLDVDARMSAGQVEVEATVTNDRTGHHVPTDSPLRQVLLVVRAMDPDGRPLAQIAGPVLPEWAGTGADPTRGRYGGMPGVAYAKVLREPWTGVSPSGAYWNPTVVETDTRLAALASDTTTYRFAAPAGGAPVSVRVTLLYRRAFFELARQKGWDLSDLVMAERELTLVRP